MKWFQRITVVCLAAVLVVITGCSSSESSKEALVNALTNVSEANSYAMNMTFTLDDVALPEEGLDDEFGEYAGFVDMLKGASVTLNGIYQKDPMRMDVEMELATAGSFEFKIKIPMIITSEKAFIQMPQIPMFPLPDSITGKFIEVDIAELTEGDQVNMEAQSKLGNELLATVMKHFDEKEYFSELKAADAGLPAGLKADKVVRVAVNNENFESTINTLIDKVVPEVIDQLLANEESLKLLQVEKAEMEQFKSEFEADKEEARAAILAGLTVNELSMTGAIVDKYLVHQDMKVNIEVTDEATAESAKLDFSIDVTYSDINKAAKFVNELPTETITFDQLMQLLQFPTDL